MGIYLPESGDPVGEEILAPSCVRSVKKGRSHRRDILLFLYGNVFPAGDVADSRSVDRAVLSVHVPASDPLLDTVVPCGGDIDDHAGVGLFSARFSFEMGIGRGLIIKSPISQCLSVYFSGKCKIFREITVVFLQKKGD